MKKILGLLLLFGVGIYGAGAVKLSESGEAPTLEQAIGLWERENASDIERDATRVAIRQGLADVEAGRVRDFAEFDREFRLAHGLPPRS